MERFMVCMLVLALSGGVKALGADEVDQLRAQVTLLRKEVLRLTEEVKQLRVENAALRTANAALPADAREELPAEPVRPAAKEEKAEKQRQCTLADFLPVSKEEAAALVGQRLYAKVMVMTIAPNKQQKGEFVVTVAGVSDLGRGVYRMLVKGRTIINYCFFIVDERTALSLDKGLELNLAGDIVDVVIETRLARETINRIYLKNATWAR